MGNLVEGLLAMMGLMSGMLVFLMTLMSNAEQTETITESSSESHNARTIHFEDWRLAA